MRKLPKALARVGVGAVAAATMLTVAPFAIGTAEAAATLTATSTNGDTAPNAATQPSATSPTPGTVTVAGAANGDTVTFAIAAGSSAYFPTAQPNGVTASADGSSASCTGNCTVNVADTVSETANIDITDTTQGGSTTASVSFDGLFFANCPQHGINGANAANSCVTQGTVNTPLALSTTLLEAGAGAANRAVTFTVSGAAFFQSGGTTYNCVTDQNGKCSFSIVDATAQQVTVTGTFAGDGGGTNGTYPGATASETVTFSSASVTPARLDLNSSTLIAPTPATTPGGYATAGEVLQNTYQLYGACNVAAGNNSCTGTALANTTVSLSVDHGFFTPNCQTGPANAPDNSYASCSFNATPAAGTKVGDIKSLGTTTTATTDSSGKFTVSLGIARDSTFDSEGFVLATVTATAGGASLTPQRPGISANTVSCSPASPTFAAGGPFGSVPGYTAGTQYFLASVGGANNQTDAAAGCHENSLWTTRTEPLNGGTAKLVVVPPVAVAHGTSNANANNLTATDSGTNNIPDVDRVVYMVQLTDQFANLTDDGASAVAVGAQGANPPSITKTGVGDLVACGGNFSDTNACAGQVGGPNPVASTQQSNGTYNQTVAAAVPSYTDVAAQYRYEADAGGNNAGANAGNAGVNDGTQTDTLSWSAPSTTFTAYSAGNSTTPAFATYSANGATAATPLTDTLTFNFYNQLTNLTVTVTPAKGTNVAAGHAVTVTAKVTDQYSNPVVSANYGFNLFVNFVRSGSNEASCLPTQTGNNNGAVNTDSSGAAGFTFSCYKSGASQVSVAVIGPGDTQLASGSTTIDFTGNAPQPSGGAKKIHPGISLKVHGSTLTATVHTTGRDYGAVVIFSVQDNGHHRSAHARLSRGGHANHTFHGLPRGRATVVATVKYHHNKNGGFKRGKTRKASKHVA